MDLSLHPLLSPPSLIKSIIITVITIININDYSGEKFEGKISKTLPISQRPYGEGEGGEEQEKEMVILCILFFSGVSLAGDFMSVVVTVYNGRKSIRFVI